MQSIIKYILLSGLRDRLYLGTFIALIVAFAIAIFFGGTVLIEAGETTATYIAGSSRIILVIGMVLFVCLNINRAFVSKEIEFILSKAVSRQKIILSYLIGFLISVAIILLPLIAVIFFITKTNLLGLLIWSLSLFAELWIVISFAILAAFILKNSFASIFSALAFYIISRLMGIFVLAIDLPQDFMQVKNNILPSILKIISLFFPRLDLFTQSEWMIYGISDFSRIKLIFLQALIYISLMSFMSFVDFRRKQF